MEQSLTTYWSSERISQEGFRSLSLFQGYELMLIYFAFKKKGSSVYTASIYGIGLSAIIYTAIAIASIVVFGHEELQRLVWPTLELVKTVRVPGLILERMESAFIAVWVASIFTTVANIYYGTIYALPQWLGMGMVFQRFMAIFLMVPLYFISLIPQNIVHLFKLNSYLAYPGFFVGVFTPVVYAVVTFIRYGRRPISFETEDTAQ
ncbi:GerAB/ArcD/ProY family transporter [Brevibacillus fortis]|uniref:GerAB/ArcD/ProY family transporter n=1 Tax=Brevibacillus fortis TaxID=2126352 RepID=UPI0038FC7925